VARRLPKFLRFLGQPYPVEVVEGLKHVADGHNHPDQEGWVHEADAYGVMTPQVNTIYLHADNGRNRMKVTLMHEALHGMLDAAHQAIVEEEDTVGTLAPLLIDFIRNNRAAVAYMQED
jgi:hypothetical protein